jgi:glycosyltransferase involved in cell wall biosynthesis
MKRVCLITCYKQPDYIRSKTLRAAFRNIETVDLIVVKNKHTGLARYFEVLWRLIVVRIKLRPDLYFITFRGYEILPFVRLITLGKPLIFDEFINLVEWVVYEHHKFGEKSLPAKILRLFYRFWLKMANLITTDTKSHAKYSAELMNLPIKKYCPLIVSADEQTFKKQAGKNKAKNANFNVLYYGSMLPLHGVNYVIEAMKLLKDQPIELTLIGGKESLGDEVNQAKLEGTKISYKTWVPFEKLPGYIESADVCLGGPFGGTIQSQFVITGKTFQFLQMSRPTIVGHNQESGLFKDKVDAIIVKRADVESLAGAILWGSQHREELNNIGLMGGELYNNKLSNLCLTKQLEALLSNNNIL